MDKREKARVQQLGRVGQFGITNAADWAATPPTPPTSAQFKAAALYAELDTPTTGTIARLEKFETGQQSGGSDFHSGTTEQIGAAPRHHARHERVERNGGSDRDGRGRARNHGRFPRAARWERRDIRGQYMREHRSRGALGNFI